MPTMLTSAFAPAMCIFSRHTVKVPRPWVLRVIDGEAVTGLTFILGLGLCRLDLSLDICIALAQSLTIVYVNH